MSALHGPRGFNPASSVPFIFGTLDAETIPGPILVELLTDAGHSLPSARALLARLRAAGSLEAQRHGRVAAYRLSGAMLTGFHGVDHGPQPGNWDGRFHTVVFDIPESERPVKDHLRYLAQNLGLGTIRPGLLISTDPARVDEGLEGVHTRGLLVRGTLEFDAATSREVAALAWDLPQRVESLRAAAHRVSAWARPGRIPAEPAIAFRSFHDNYLHSIGLRLTDPGLPPELLPADWPAGELDQALRRMMTAWNDAVTAHVETLLLRSPHAWLVHRRER